MSEQLGGLTTAFISSGVKWCEPFGFISTEVLTDEMKGRLPAELLRRRRLRSRS